MRICYENWNDSTPSIARKERREQKRSDIHTKTKSNRGSRTLQERNSSLASSSSLPEVSLLRALKGPVDPLYTPTCSLSKPYIRTKVREWKAHRCHRRLTAGQQSGPFQESTQC